MRRIADRVCVMKDGEIVEEGPAAEIFANPQHAYTRKLLAAEPSGTPPPVPDDAKELVAAQDLKVWFPIQKGFMRKTVDHVKAVNDASLSVRAGETLGIVGESGSGKTTLLRTLAGLQPPYAGEVISELSGAKENEFSRAKIKSFIVIQRCIMRGAGKNKRVSLVIF